MSVATPGTWLVGCLSLFMVSISTVPVRTSHAQAQEQLPRFVLATGGPQAPVVALRFSPDGSRLYAPCADKAAYVYQSLPQVGIGDWTLDDTFRWETARGLRGVMLCGDLSPDGQLLAVAGSCARLTNGDIWIFDARTGALKTVLGGPIDAREQARAQHTLDVVEVRFSPGSDYLVSADFSGAAIVWRTSDWSGERVAIPARSDRRRTDVPFDFVSSHECAISLGENAAGSTEIRQFDVRRPGQTRRLEHDHQGVVNVIRGDGKGRRWLTADEKGSVRLSDGGGPVGRIDVGGGGVQSATFDGDKRLYLGTSNLAQNSSRLLAYELKSLRRIHEIPVSRRTIRDIAVSPDSHTIAIRCEQVDGFFLLQKVGAHSEELVFAGAVWSRRAGSGKAPVIRFTGEERQLEILDDSSAKRKWRFDPATARVQRLPLNAEEVVPEDFPEWTLVAKPKEGRVAVTKGAVERFVTGLDENDGFFARACWIRDGGLAPWGIAVGTTQGRIFVYRIPSDEKEEISLVRYFRDHVGAVTSLSCSHDGKYLASSGADGTIKFWSLAGLRSEGRKFSQFPGWGADFVAEGAAVRAVYIEPGGIADKRGIKVNDLFDFFVTDDDQGRPVRILGGAQILQAMEKHPLRRMCLLFPPSDEDNPAARPKILLTPAWEEIASLFIDADDEWAFWTPEGYYAASPSGDERFGWLQNVDWNQPPKYVSGDQLREQFEKPDVMRRLFAAGSVDQALAAGNAKALDIRVEIARKPELQILSPAPGMLVTGTFPIQAKARFFPPTDPANYEARCTVNGIPAKRLPSVTEGNDVTYSWQGIASPAASRIEILLVPRGARPEVREIAVRRIVPSRSDDGSVRMHLVGIAAGEAYGVAAARNKSVEKGNVRSTLVSPALLTREIFDRLESRPASGMTVASHETLIEAEVTQDGVRTFLDERLRTLQGEVRPQDLVVIYVCGHGWSDESSGYHFICPDMGFFSPYQSKTEMRELLPRAGVPWSDFRKLAELPCRKAFFIDTCTSGNIVETERSISGDAIRPLANAGAYILASCRAGTNGWEIPIGGSKRSALGHAISRALDGEADGLQRPELTKPTKDRTVDISEVEIFATNQVAILVNAIENVAIRSDSDIIQMPISAGASLGRVPLVFVPEN